MRNTRLALAVLTGMVSAAGGVAAIPALADAGTTSPAGAGASPVADPASSASSSALPSASSSSGAPTTTVARPAVTGSTQAPARARVTPNFGVGKTDGIPVGVEVASGAYVPPTGTTAGSEIKIVETGPCEDASDECEDVRAQQAPLLAAHHAHLVGGTARRAHPAAGSDSETTYCTTQADPDTLGKTGAASETFCDLSDTDTFGDHAGANGYVPYPGDNVTVTQVSVPIHAAEVVDSQVIAHTNCDVLGYLGPDGPRLATVCFDADGVDSSPTADFQDAGLPPVATNLPASLLIGQSADLEVLADDQNDGAPETITGVTQPAHGTATIEGAGTYSPSPSPSPTVSITDSVTDSESISARTARAATGAQTILYTPKTGFLGKDHFTYTITTANGSATGSVLVDVVAPPPTAVNHTARTVGGVPVTVNVTTGDNAHGGGALSVTAVGVPSHGTASISGDDVTYRPAPGFVGTDAFSYTVATPYGTAKATVTVTVVAAATGSSLPFTGLDAEGLALGAVTLIGGGAGVRILGRRRRGDHR